jgi:hypothetical protein
LKHSIASNTASTLRNFTKMKKYIQEFFDVLNDDKLFRSIRFLASCRTEVNRCEIITRSEIRSGDGTHTGQSYCDRLALWFYGTR